MIRWARRADHRFGDACRRLADLTVDDRPEFALHTLERAVADADNNQQLYAKIMRVQACLGGYAETWKTLRLLEIRPGPTGPGPVRPGRAAHGEAGRLATRSAYHALQRQPRAASVVSSANQNWVCAQQADGSYTVANGRSHLCMDVSGASITAGAQVVQAPCTTATSQR